MTVPVIVLLVSAGGCKHPPEPSDRQSPAPAAASAEVAPGASPARPPAPRDGMVWVPGGALVAGTSPNEVPRAADEEMAGEQLVLEGFYIDRYPYPNEEGAIPVTGSSLDEAAARCAEQGKRLCSELEWERSCKGPEQSTYEYGGHYSADRCGTGQAPRLTPAGYRVACVSGFGVRDMHGGAWEWTDSPWRRRGATGLVTLRGGNGVPGEVYGRCANGRGEAPGTRRGDIGFRCCAGDRNRSEVSLSVREGAKLERLEPIDASITGPASANWPEGAAQVLGATPEAFRAERAWRWRPVSGEELIAVTGCDRSASLPRCGLLVGRRNFERVRWLAWASSGYVPGALFADSDARFLVLTGEGPRVPFQVSVRYGWGLVEIGQRQPRRSGVPR